MDLIQLIIELIAKAFESPKPRGPSTGSPDEIVRLLQARIEATRKKDPRALQRPAPGPMRAKLQPAGRPQAASRKTKRKAPPALPKQVEPMPPLFAAAPAKIAPPPTPAKPAVTNVDAKLLSRWLRPQTLRSQFILTEIFQPPIALRDSHLS